MVFVLAHVGHVVCLLLHIFEVEELLGDKRSFTIEFGEVGSQLIDV